MKSFADLARRTFRRAAKGQTDSTRNKAKLAVTLLEDRSVPATVAGTIFYDGNGDRTQDAGENYVVGIGVLLSGFGGSSQTAMTDSFGHYVFSNVSPGSYAVIVTGAPTGYTAELATGSVNPIDVATDTDDIGVGFGLEGGAGTGSGSGSGSGSSGNPSDFDLEGFQGTLNYTIPWTSVDPDQASQSLPLTDLTLVLDGHTFLVADFASTPTIQFQYGLYQGITFNLDTSTVPGYPFVSISMSGDDTIQAVDASTLQTVDATLASKPDGAIVKTAQGTGVASIDATVSWKSCTGASSVTINAYDVNNNLVGTANNPTSKAKDKQTYTVQTNAANATVKLVAIIKDKTGAAIYTTKAFTGTTK